jgi:hypothetical protein
VPVATYAASPKMDRPRRVVAPTLGLMLPSRAEGRGESVPIRGSLRWRRSGACDSIGFREGHMRPFGVGCLSDFDVKSLSSAAIAVSNAGRNPLCFDSRLSVAFTVSRSVNAERAEPRGAVRA